MLATSATTRLESCGTGTPKLPPFPTDDDIDMERAIERLRKSDSRARDVPTAALRRMRWVRDYALLEVYMERICLHMDGLWCGLVAGIDDYLSKAPPLRVPPHRAAAAASAGTNAAGASAVTLSPTMVAGPAPTAARSDSIADVQATTGPKDRLVATTTAEARCNEVDHMAASTECSNSNSAKERKGDAIEFEREGGADEAGGTARRQEPCDGHPEDGPKAAAKDGMAGAAQSTLRRFDDGGEQVTALPIVASSTLLVQQQMSTHLSSTLPLPPPPSSLPPPPSSLLSLSPSSLSSQVPSSSLQPKLLSPPPTSAYPQQTQERISPSGSELRVTRRQSGLNRPTYVFASAYLSAECPGELNVPALHLDEARSITPGDGIIIVDVNSRYALAGLEAASKIDMASSRIRFRERDGGCSQVQLNSLAVAARRALIKRARSSASKAGSRASRIVLPPNAVAVIVRKACLSTTAAKGAASATHESTASPGSCLLAGAAAAAAANAAAVSTEDDHAGGGQPMADRGKEIENDSTRSDADQDESKSEQLRVEHSLEAQTAAPSVGPYLRAATRSPETVDALCKARRLHNEERLTGSPQDLELEEAKHQSRIEYFRSQAGLVAEEERMLRRDEVDAETQMLRVAARRLRDNMAARDQREAELAELDGAVVMASAQSSSPDLPSVPQTEEGSGSSDGGGDSLRLQPTAFDSKSVKSSAATNEQGDVAIRCDKGESASAVGGDGSDEAGLAAAIGNIVDGSGNDGGSHNEDEDDHDSSEGSVSEEDASVAESLSELDRKSYFKIMRLIKKDKLGWDVYTMLNENLNANYPAILKAALEMISAASPAAYDASYAFSGTSVEAAARRDGDDDDSCDGDSKVSLSTVLSDDSGEPLRPPHIAPASTRRQLVVKTLVSTARLVVAETDGEGRSGIDCHLCNVVPMSPDDVWGALGSHALIRIKPGTVLQALVTPSEDDSGGVHDAVGEGSDEGSSSGGSVRVAASSVKAQRRSFEAFLDANCLATFAQADSESPPIGTSLDPFHYGFIEGIDGALDDIAPQLRARHAASSSSLESAANAIPRGLVGVGMGMGAHDLSVAVPDFEHLSIFERAQIESALRLSQVEERDRHEASRRGLGGVNDATINSSSLTDRNVDQIRPLIGDSSGFTTVLPSSSLWRKILGTFPMIPTHVNLDLYNAVRSGREHAGNGDDAGASTSGGSGVAENGNGEDDQERNSWVAYLTLVTSDGTVDDPDAVSHAAHLLSRYNEEALAAASEAAHVASKARRGANQASSSAGPGSGLGTGVVTTAESGPRLLYRASHRIRMLSMDMGYVVHPPGEATGRFVSHWTNSTAGDQNPNVAFNFSNHHHGRLGQVQIELGVDEGPEAYPLSKEASHLIRYGFEDLSGPIRVYRSSDKAHENAGMIISARFKAPKLMYPATNYRGYLKWRRGGVDFTNGAFAMSTSYRFTFQDPGGRYVDDLVSRFRDNDAIVFDFHDYDLFPGVAEARDVTPRKRQAALAEDKQDGQSSRAGKDGRHSGGTGATQQQSRQPREALVDVGYAVVSPAVADLLDELHFDVVIQLGCLLSQRVLACEELTEPLLAWMLQQSPHELAPGLMQLHHLDQAPFAPHSDGYTAAFFSRLARRLGLSDLSYDSGNDASSSRAGKKTAAAGLSSEGVGSTKNSCGGKKGEAGIEVSVHQPMTDKHGGTHIGVLHCRVTPLRIIFSGPARELSFRALREFRHVAHRFLRVTFADEDRSIMSSQFAMLLKDKTKQCLDEGIQVPLMKGRWRRHEFLNFSASQAREHSCFMFAPEYGDADASVSCDTIRVWLGDFSDVHPAAKCAARLGQTMGGTYAVCELEPSEIVVEDDITTHDGKYVFTDGCGRMSRSLAVHVAETLRLDVVPSAFQIRLGGFKGVLSVDDGDAHLAHVSSRSFWVVCRPSMKKFRSSHTVLEVLNWSQTSREGHLNEQLAILLCDLGVSPDALKEQCMIHVRRLAAFSSTDTVTVVGAIGGGGPSGLGGSRASAEQIVRLALLSSASPREPFIEHTLKHIQEDRLKKFESRKHRIRLNGSRFFLGISDSEMALLKMGEVYVRPSVFKNGEVVPGDPLTGTVAVCRFPAHHPGDIRLLQAVDRPELGHYVDVIVFPVVGRRDHPSEMSGGDVDGDNFLVIWNPELVPKLQREPMVASEVSLRQRDMAEGGLVLGNDRSRPVTIDEIKRFFIQYLEYDQLGVISTAFIYQWDRQYAKHKTPTLTSQCLRLAELASLAVDAAKSGKIPRLPPDLAIESVRRSRPSTRDHDGGVDGDQYNDDDRDRRGRRRRRSDDTNKDHANNDEGNQNSTPGSADNAPAYHYRNEGHILAQLTDLAIEQAAKLRRAWPLRDASDVEWVQPDSRLLPGEDYETRAAIYIPTARERCVRFCKSLRSVLSAYRTRDSTLIFTDLNDVGRGKGKSAWRAYSSRTAEVERLVQIEASTFRREFEQRYGPNFAQVDVAATGLSVKARAYYEAGYQMAIQWKQEGFPQWINALYFAWIHHGELRSILARGRGGGGIAMHVHQSLIGHMRFHSGS